MKILFLIHDLWVTRQCLGEVLYPPSEGILRVEERHDDGTSVEGLENDSLRLLVCSGSDGLG